MAAPANDSTAQFLGRLAERRHEPLLETTTGTVRLELRDGKRVDRWFIAVDKGDIAVSRKNMAADCTLRADKALFDGIARGRVNATAAVLRGAVTLEGDWELLVLLQRLFPGPPNAKGPRNGGARGKKR
jgi:putative sterol carrier protein